MNKIVGVRTEPEADGFGDEAIEWHVVSVTGADYATACGLDGDDSYSGQFGIVEQTKAAKVTCPQCYALWRGLRALKLREVNFDLELCS